MNNKDLAYIPATDALKAFREGSLSPVDLMQAVIARCETAQPVVNALTDSWFDQALKQAKASESRYVKGKAKKLDGLPLAVKDEFALKGTRRTSSSLVYQDRIDQHTDVVIDRLLKAGAICHTKTATPEFCLLGSCHSRLWGTTRNPWDTNLSPGGSSGGSGAALAAGMTTLATGTDIGGSIRIPSAQCGLAGYKPPYGRNPEIPIFNLDFYSHSGPMARSTKDIALMQNVMSGPHHQDIASLRQRVRLDSESIPTDLTGWKVAYSLDLGFFDIDEDVRTNTLSIIETLRTLGAEVEAVEIGWNEDIIEAVYAYWAFNWASSMRPLLSTHRDLLTDYAIFFLESAQNYTPEDYAQSIRTTVDMYNRFGPMMDRFDLFICPTLATNKVPADFTWPASPVKVNDKNDNLVEERWSLTYPFNMLSRCPVLQLPSGLGQNGVPTGVQLVGKTYMDKSVIEAGKALEAANGPLDWPDL